MIYLDSAATTLQKPAGVARAMARAAETMTTPGRGSHPPAMAAADTVFRCRGLAAELFDVRDPERVIFTFNGTHGLNIAIRSLVKPGSRVVVSGFEHNAVTRPLTAIGGVTVSVAAGRLFDRQSVLEAFKTQLDRPADAVICTQMSNVFGFISPLDEIAALCREKGVPLIVDAAQGAGCCPVTVEGWGAAYVAMPGHKGLYGPQGTGLLLCGRDSTPQVLLAGGTGSFSERQDMPEFLPDRLEAGTHNVSGIAGLLEGLRFVKRRGWRQILAHEQGLVARMAAGLRRIPGVEVFSAEERGAQGGVLSFRVEGRDCEEIGETLGRRGIAVRAGLHCAPLAHDSAGTLETGTVRASVSAFNTPQEIGAFLAAVERLSHKGRK